MTIDYSNKNDVEPHPMDDAVIRKKAVKRAWICPGAGAALVGHGAYAIATFVASLCIAPAIAWVAFRPSAASLWTTVAVIVVATGLWLAEQIVVKKAAIRPPNPSILDRGFFAATLATYLVVVLACGMLITAFGSLRMAGSGMSPTFENGERLIYHKYVDWQTVKPGSIIVYKNADDSAWGEPGWLMVSRIIAGPGDRISIQNGEYVVNKRGGPPALNTGEHKVVLDIPSSPETLTVPEDCYFIVQDSPKGGFDSRVLSWVRADNFLGSRLWYLSGRGICKPVE